RPTRREEPAGPVRHPQPLAKPVEHDELDLVRPGRNRPHSGEEVVTAGEPVAENGRKSRDARYITEKVRVRLPGMKREHALRELGDRAIEANPLLRRRRRDGADEASFVAA